jgi:FkbM family methyltransferase
MRIRTAARDLVGHFPLIDGLFRRFVWSRIHFPEVEMRFIDALGAERIDVAIDVGAATGSYAWILNRKSRLVFCFEPGEFHARCLERSVFGSRIRVVRAAVGDFGGEVKMYTPGSDTNALHSATLSSANPVAGQRETQVRDVQQVTLDEFFADKLEGRTVDLIKVDVEGYELQVFLGAGTLISRYHPLIFCEIEMRHNERYREVFRLLRSGGYVSCIFRDGAFRVFQGEALDELQTMEALKDRLDGTYDPQMNRYVNNFVFQHELSRIKVIQ